MESLIQSAYFAGGCFWGVEYLFQKNDGVIEVTSGYMGGTQKNPTYQDVIYRNSGHLEVVKVNYDSKVVTYQELVKLFFEIHDFTQTNGQGPDIGYQYLSAIFVQNEIEREIAQNLIKKLEEMNYSVATKLIDGEIFYSAEDYHQNYYDRNGKTPYCHSYKKVF